MVNQKEPKDMNLGEIVEAMISVAIATDRSLRALDGQGSPYSREADIRKGISDRYDAAINPLKEELSKREQAYSPKK